MDQVKIGKFIAQCRNEKNITQEELGEKLGVTNKTISRWENGHYLPDIEMMQLLSKEFSISINELISGEKIKDLDYKKGMEKYYTVNDEKNNKLAEEYRKLATQEENVIFGGRLAEYKYYNIDAMCRKAMELAEEIG